MNEAQPKSAPVFVKIDEYKDILDILTMIKTKLKETKSILDNITELKKEEDSELELWNTTLAEIESKIDLMDQTLVQPEYPQ